MQKPKLDGAYTLLGVKHGDSILPEENGTKYKTVQIFRDGYWITTSFTEQLFKNALVVLTKW